MDSLESWLEFRKGEIVDNEPARCHHCGGECSGDVTEVVEGVEVVICDDPDNCPANHERLGDQLIREATAFRNWNDMLEAMGRGYVPTFSRSRPKAKELGERLQALGWGVFWIN